MTIAPLLYLLNLMGCSVHPGDNVSGWSCTDEAGTPAEAVTGTYQGSTTNSPTQYIVKVGESEYECNNVRNLTLDKVLAGCASEYDM